MKELFKGTQYSYEIIREVVIMYCSTPLSFRECEKFMARYLIKVDHTTIYRWVQEYSKVLYALWKKQNRRMKSRTNSWRMDETYVKIKGKKHYLYRAIDSNGNTLDMWLRKHRDTKAAKAFFKRLVREYGAPRALVTDKYSATLKAVRELQKEEILPKDLDHRTAKVLNNILEQDHRLIKKRIPKSCGLQTMRTGKATLQGIEVMHALDKQSRSDQNHSDHFLWDKFDELFQVA
ncbi:IS6 family transposase [Enterococcus faecalis]|uniref:IS6 family transposase n=1 Tax=Enterococcus faecalis TaxID=1351 RepID=UPI0025B072C9|nr:IS6 family transposase [Enterococcus faecalis]MDN3077074.1 IS6 family transposase [Enterococcus faecalis]